MSRRRGRGAVWPNNSGVDRSPNNVWIAMPSERNPNQLVVAQSNFYEDELQEVAVRFPDYIIFVTHGGLEDA